MKIKFQFLEVSKNQIRPNSNIVTDLGIDSIDFLDVAYEIDKEYKIKLPLESWTEKVNSQEASLDDYFSVNNLTSHIEGFINKNRE